MPSENIMMLESIPHAIAIFHDLSANTEIHEHLDWDTTRRD